MSYDSLLWCFLLDNPAKGWYNEVDFGEYKNDDTLRFCVAISVYLV